MFTRRNTIGPAFGDYIGFEQYSRREKKANDNDGSKITARGNLLPFLLVVIFFILFVRLFHLQIFEGSYYRTLSDSNRIKTTLIYGPRGIIFDRNNVPLVFNVPGFRTVISGKTVVLSQKLALELISKGAKNIEVDSLRQYPYKESFAHVLGYIGQISQDELGSNLFSDYSESDLIGKNGIERQYEKLLKGDDGKILAEVDADGKVVRALGRSDPIPGKDITLTLDNKLQLAAYDAMEKVEKGAVIASTPKGEILALVSKPSFDPNLFTLGQHYKPSSQSAYSSLESVLLDSESQPLLNRAISGTYPPGSTFKLITAASGLENKIIDETFTVTDTGVIIIGAFSFSNWYFTQHGGKDGEVDVVKGIARSNDIFFYKLAGETGVEKLAETARRFGLGQRLGIDLPSEAKGIVPSDSWKREAIGDGWYLGDTYHLGIGQGYVLTTPLQVNSWTQVIANGGTLYKPHLLKNPKSEIRNPKLIGERTRELIRKGMIDSCGPGGVAWPLFEFKIQSSKFKDYRQISIACKTGTAQHGGEEDLPHAWITLFAPAYDPQIVITVLAESSGEGSNIAAPIAKKVLEEWFGR